MANNGLRGCPRCGKVTEFFEYEPGVYTCEECGYESDTLDSSEDNTPYKMVNRRVVCDLGCLMCEACDDCDKFDGENCQRPCIEDDGELCFYYHQCAYHV